MAACLPAVDGAAGSRPARPPRSLAVPGELKSVVHQERGRAYARDELPAAFVADTGEVVMGLSDPDEARPFLRGDSRAAASDRPVRRLPRIAKFSAAVHSRTVGGALMAALISAPVLYVGPDAMPWALDWLLCALAAVPVVVLPVRGIAEASHALPDGVRWTVQEESDPSIA
ncbi:hypothetical protein ACIHEJ_40160 [Streptomyces sp. NPDC052301]|uniref:hypothetical protein n=1 Tax=Streptomyces sp. NPDC052301 TaxID=3365687 RepID=UPI0037D1607F